MHDLSRVRVTGPLEPFVVGFAAALHVDGYSARGTAGQLQLMAHLSRWLAQEYLGVASLTGAVVERFVVARRGAGYAQFRSPRALEPLLSHLRELGQAPRPSLPEPEGPVEELLCRFRRYLIEERGLRAASAIVYCDAVRPFLEARLTPRGLQLADLDAGCIAAFVLAQEHGSAKQIVSRLRSLLGFLHLEGMISRPLASAVPAVARWRLSPLPKGISSVEVQRLLGACDRRTAMGRRDFAILTTLARLGLRPAEVANLRLCDIDWHRGEIAISGKGPRLERLPLPADVGAAIAAYLRRGRPRSAHDKGVFLRVCAPHRALTACAVSAVAMRASKRAGIAHVHAYRLRHTAASELLAAGASLQEVGQVLRHERPETTAIYAKVDREALRTLARPWPGGVA
jgi:site-specific recombinase XerD